MHYHHLTQDDRKHIHRLLQAQTPIAHIAQYIRRSRATVYREIQRNAYEHGYCQSVAQAQARARLRARARRPKISPQLMPQVIELLKRKWTPEQIAHTLKGISHQTIYQRIYADSRAGGTLWRCLVRQRRRPLKSNTMRSSRSSRAAKPCIRDRPAIIESRQTRGHFEIDTMWGKGKRHALVTIVERCSRFLWVGQVSRLTAKNTLHSIVRQLGSLKRSHPHLVQTITTDQGTEFARYAAIEASLDVDFFFADPGCPWQRGSIENANGLLRRFYPKGTDLSKINRDQLRALVQDLNHRPRECLGWRTPHEVLFSSDSLS